MTAMAPEKTPELDMSVEGTGWWLKRLYGELFDTKVQGYLGMLDRYNRGEHNLPEGNKRHRATFKNLQRVARSNYTGLVAAAVLERLTVTGFSTGGASGDDELDDEAWMVWQENRLDVNSALVHGAALVFSRAFVIVGENPRKPGRPLITAEDPRKVIAAIDPADGVTVLAALKCYDDDIRNQRHAILYLPSKIVYFKADIPADGVKAETELVWTYETISSVTGTTVAMTNAVGEISNPLGEVPVVPFVNRPQLDGTGMSEFEDVIDAQDRINNEILDRLVISKMQAYRQRWMTGVEMSNENGQRQKPFEPGADMVWAVEDENAKFGDFDETDLTPILKAVDSDVRDLAATSRTPPHYLLGQMVNISGDALQAAEAGLVSKCKARILVFSDAWETVMRLAFKVMQRDLPADTQMKWDDPALYTLSARGDAGVKYAAAGASWRAVMETIGFSPQDIARQREEKISDAMIGALALPGPQQGGVNAAPPTSVFAPPVPTQLQTDAMKGNAL